MDDPNDAKLLDHVARYNLAHKNPVNRVMHFIGIPFAAIAGLGLLSKLAWHPIASSVIRPDAAWPALLVAIVFYFRDGWLLSLATVASLLAYYFAGLLLPWYILCVLAAVGAICHWIGHYLFEHKPPLLFSRPIAVLEAPAWLLAFWTRK